MLFSVQIMLEIEVVNLRCSFCASMSKEIIMGSSMFVCVLHFSSDAGNLCDGGSLLHHMGSCFIVSLLFLNPWPCICQVGCSFASTETDHPGLRRPGLLLRVFTTYGARPLLGTAPSGDSLK